MNKVMFKSEKDEWETPQDLFDALNARYGFTLDAAASAENAKCASFYTKEDDALTKDWRGTVWCNPPYGRGVGKFVQKGYFESLKGVQVVMLLAARTDTEWWHDYVMVANDVFLIRGRLRFVGASYPAPFPSAVVVWERPGGLTEFWSMSPSGIILRES